MPEIDVRILGPIRAGLGFKVGYQIYNRDYRPGHIIDQRVDLRKRIDAGLTGNLKLSFKILELFCRYDHGIVTFKEVIFIDEQGNSIARVDQLSRNLQMGVSIFLN